MSVQPGWYDAGVSGRERWWDGTQWTAQERAVAVPGHVAPVPMGWFPVAGTPDIRWWDGAGWTPYRLREGRARPDAFAIEPANNGVLLGAVFILLGVSQLSTYNLSGQPFFLVTPFFFFIAGALWLIGGLRAAQLKKLPAPSTMPVFDASVRPLPGEAEGAGAGWFPVAGQVARWWTGARWSPYIAQKFGVRPTLHGAQAYRNSMIIGGVIVGLGVLAAVFGVAMVGVVGWWTAVMTLLPAGIFVLAGGLALLMVYLRRYTMILPPPPPPPPPPPLPPLR